MPAEAHELGKNTPQSKETIELEGRVVEALPSAVFRVQIALPAGKTGTGAEILAHLAGRLRVNRIRILPGDKVRIELTPYDLTRGRIIRRL